MTIPRVLEPFDRELPRGATTLFDRSCLARMPHPIAYAVDGEQLTDPAEIVLSTTTRFAARIGRSSAARGHRQSGTASRSA